MAIDVIKNKVGPLPPTPRTVQELDIQGLYRWLNTVQQQSVVQANAIKELQLYVGIP